ncbi:glycerophosphodiester phosphodiesterase family protein [Alteribacillus sp. HJP-4]|uniref:glycerophosphodiester phosphodiesterase family protein n=1 Tax=Alteribacillus sp. HJP-4 TaxID=2775394 RepID=UPI0035CCE92D
MKWKKRLKWFVTGLLLLIIFIYVNNSSFFAEERNEDPLLLAHRGLGQPFSMENIESDTCTAERIFQPEHSYLENTIPSMEAAFELGADIVEFDIMPTKDGQFAVFHDAGLDCRTDSGGTTQDYTMDELRKLDVGYGYTADDGKTYPFRGKGIGMMPSLDEVVSSFPDESFLIHIKSNEREEGHQLAEYLKELPESRTKQLAVYGGDKPIAALNEDMPDMRVMSMESLKSCMLPYIGVGWSGYVPDSCHNTQIHLPEKFAPWIWGWPDKFLNRMEAAGTRVIVVAGDGGWSEGFDSAKDMERLPDDFSGGIWTNRIDIIAPSIRD